MQPAALTLPAEGGGGAAGKAVEAAATKRGFRIRALGEIAIRCGDLEAMERFHAEVIGLALLSRRAGGISFFRVADGNAGNTAALALFAFDAATRPGLHPRGERPETGARSSLHIALSLGWQEQEAIAWYDRIGQAYRVEHFDWIGWRGVFTEDPEGDTVELVSARSGDAA